MPNRIKLGVPYSNNVGGYNWYEAYNTPERNEHASSRNPITGRILKSEDHPTFPKTVIGEKKLGYHFYRDPQGNLYTSEKPISEEQPYNMIYNEVDIPIDMDWIKKRQAYAESRFNLDKTSHKEADGLFQITPIAVKEYITTTGNKGDLKDKEYNTKVRDWYFDRVYNTNTTKYDNQVEHLARTLAAYNWGIGNLSKAIQKYSDSWFDHIPLETKNYINFILYGDDIKNSDLNEDSYQKALSTQQHLKSGGVLFAKSGIHIKPENRGKFTALKKRTGKSSTWYKEHGTPAQKKMAIFALNSKHWHHGNN